MNIQVLYEDNHLIAVYKPAGMLVQGDKTGEVSLMDEVKKYIKETYHKPGNVFLGLIHRLDRNVSGIVLFAKTSKGASRLSEQFRTHSVEKIYHAWVEGAMPKTKDVLINYLLKHEENNTTEVVSKSVNGALYAELSYECIKKEEREGSIFSLVQIKLKTGRSHQIRVQLSYSGHPIVGDSKYGSKHLLPDHSIKLFATSLSFDGATDGLRKKVEIKIPDFNHNKIQSEE